MIDLYYWSTPNGHKITMFLEETGLPYKIFPINIGKGDQFKPEFLAISPNNRMPAIVDQAPADGGGYLSKRGEAKGVIGPVGAPRRGIRVSRAVIEVGGVENEKFEMSRVAAQKTGAASEQKRERPHIRVGIQGGHHRRIAWNQRDRAGVFGSQCERKRACNIGQPARLDERVYLRSNR